MRDDVKRAWIDGSFATVVTEPGMANFDHFLRSMQELDGDMGVPITFLEQHNPDQFEIVSFSEDNLAKEAGIMQDRTGRTKPEVEEDGKCKNVWRASSSATCAPSRARRPSMQIERRKTIVSEVVAGYHNNAYKVMTGQRRTIAFCEYIDGAFGVDDQYFCSLPDDQMQVILGYKLFVYVYDGTDSKKRGWFRIINIAGERLTD